MRRLLAFAVLCLAALTAFASPAYQFHRINTANSGLSYDGVSRIIQDSRGFIWIGTFNGLNRYDGNRFNVYSKEDLGLDSDFVHTIIEDREGNLWVGTDAGVSRYIYKEDRFEPFNVESDLGTRVRNKVTCLYADSAGNIWIISNYQGCFRYSIPDGSLVNFRDRERSGPEYNTDNQLISFRRIIEDGKGGFWLSRYHNSLWHADADLSDITPAVIAGDPDYFKGDQIENFFHVNGRLLIASNLHGLSYFDSDTGEVTELFPLPKDVDLVDAYLDKDRWVWLSTTSGVCRYDLAGVEAPLYIKPDKNDRFSIFGNYVYTCFVDRDGGLWIGTKDGGVSFSGSFQRNIHKVYAAGGHSLSGAVVSGFAWDGKDRVWVTTENSGLLCYSISTGLAQMVNAPGLPRTLTTVLYDDGRLWLGSLDGLYRYDCERKSIFRYGPLKRSSGSNDPRVYLSWRSASGQMYFANTLGLFRYRPSDDSFLQIPEFDGVFVTSLAEMEDGTIWVSSYATGVFVWDPLRGRIVANYRFADGSNLPSDKVSSLFKDSAGRIWTVGFSNGISCFEGGRFVPFNTGTTTSLPTDVYFGGLYDAAGKLWFTSDKGFVQLDPDARSVSIYTEKDGMLEAKMSRACLALPWGEIFGGFDNGFVHFDPKHFDFMKKAPRIVVSGMEIDGSPVSGNVDLMEQIRLEAGQNAFGFEFSIMNFSLQAANRIRCRLEGYDEEWKDVTSSKSVYYYNVPPGKYRLRLSSSALGSEWVESENSLLIELPPSFFASTPGIVLLSLLFAVMLLLTVYFVNRRQNAIRVREEENYRREAESEMTREKMDFFSHVVHEIKTPLTLIKTPLQSVMSKDRIDDDARHDLKVMQSNTEYLTQLVNELLEFVRVERKGYSLNCEDIDLVEKIGATVFNYSDTAAGKNIKLNFSCQGDGLWVSADAAALSKMLNNLLINALKHADSRIDVTVSSEGNTVAVTISNDGDTIPVEARESVFKPFVQYKSSDKSYGGVGIGLPLARSLARMHSGDIVIASEPLTTFVLTLPRIEAPEIRTNGKTDAKVEEKSLPVLMIVDDNSDMREFISRKMSSEYCILTACSADEAAALLQTNDIDVVITDISMPGRDGLSLCRDIRADVENSHLPIIVLSARTSVESKIQAIEAGADIYMEKPFDLEYLRSCMKNIVDRRSLMKEALGSGVMDADVTMFGLPKRDEEFYLAFDRVIKENLGNSELSNDMIAEAMCMSQSSMIRKIRKLLNTTPSNYLKVQRLAAAASLLRDSGGNNISDICYAVGFTNLSYFAKCFKEQYGVTPSEYIQK